MPDSPENKTFTQRLSEAAQKVTGGPEAAKRRGLWLSEHTPNPKETSQRFDNSKYGLALRRLGAKMGLVDDPDYSAQLEKLRQLDHALDNAQYVQQVGQLEGLRQRVNAAGITPAPDKDEETP